MLRAATLGALAIAGALSVVVPNAQASTAYRYWSYWNADAGEVRWTYATEGSGTHVPADGAVEGWSFGTGSDPRALEPATSPDFASICAGVRVSDDAKRVGIVIDPGEPVDAPDGQTPTRPRTQCVTGPAGATGLELLRTVVAVRLEAGFVCGIDDYPVGECAPLVEEPTITTGTTTVDPPRSDTAQLVVTAPPPAERSSIGSPLTTAAAISLIAVVAFGTWRRSRRGGVR